MKGMKVDILAKAKARGFTGFFAFLALKVTELLWRTLLQYYMAQKVHHFSDYCLFVQNLLCERFRKSKFTLSKKESE